MYCRRFQRVRFLLAVAATGCLLIGAASAADSLRDDLRDLDAGPRWVYDDWESAKAQAARTNKPVFALFR